MAGKNINNLKVISFNVNGVLNPVKRSKILGKMKKENAQVVLLQETHLSKNLKRLDFLGYTIHLSDRVIDVE